MDGVVWFIETRYGAQRNWRRDDEPCKTGATANKWMKEDMKWDATHCRGGEKPTEFRVTKYVREEPTS